MTPSTPPKPTLLSSTAAADAPPPPTAAVRRVFDQIDRDHSGFIDPSELREALRKLGLPFDTASVQQIVARIDTNHDGKLDWGEFRAYALAREQEIRDVFAQIDRNGDGVWSIDELQQGFRELGINIDPAIVRQLYKHLDLNHDGVLSLDEFRHATLLFPMVQLRYIFERWRDVALVDTGDSVVLPPKPVATLQDVNGTKPAEVAPEAVAPSSSETATWLISAKVLAAGAFAGVVSRTSTAPLDRLKTVMQAMPRTTTSGAPSPTLVATFLAMYREGGVQSFFRGNGTNVLKVVPENAFKFFAYESFQNLLWSDPTDPTVVERLVAGGLAGLTAQSFVYPLEVIKTRLAVTPKGTFRGLWDCMIVTARQDGIRAFYRGYVPSAIGIFPFAAIDLGMFSFLRDMWIKWYPGESPSVLALLACGAVSSTCAAVTTFPVQLIRTRLQAQGLELGLDYDGATTKTTMAMAASGGPGSHKRLATVKYHGMIDCFVRTWKQEGIPGLFRGLLPNMMKTLPAISISYVVYENSKKIFGI